MGLFEGAAAAGGGGGITYSRGWITMFIDKMFNYTRFNGTMFMIQCSIIQLTMFDKVLIIQWNWKADWPTANY